ncbi:MAG: chemotaxis protein CheX, partial [Bryobacteraceae bacterium]|jgi:chemotaxis protein CheX
MTEIDSSAPAESSSDISEIVTSVFQAMLGLDVAPSGAMAAPPGERRVVALVRFGGRANGCLIFETGVEQARRFAGRFLCSEPLPADDITVRDVIGELANMICGNLKSTLAPGAVLAMPEVVAGEPSELVGEPAAERCSFSSDDGPFCVVSFRKPR